MSAEVKTAIVLAGGEGTRLRPLTNTRPKPLLPVLGRPCIEYSLSSLASARVERAFLACGYRSADIVAAIGDGRSLGIEVVYAFEEEPAGTAGAVKLLEDDIEGTTVVMSGDVLADVDIASLIHSHREKGAVVTMAITDVSTPGEFGIVGLSEDDRIVRFKEKPAPAEVFSNLINAGIYVLEPEAVSRIPEGQKFDFSKNLFPNLLADGMPLYGSRLRGLWKDIGRSSDLLEANIRMAARRGRPVEDGGARIVGEICASTFTAEGASLEAPLYLGEGVIVENGSRIASSAVGRGTVVGAEAEICNSLLMDRCSVGKGCVLRGSVLGEGCRIGPGVRILESVLGDGVILEGPASLERRTLD